MPPAEKKSPGSKPLIAVKNVSFAWWNEDAPENRNERTIDDLTIVFENFSANFEAGITSVLGQNGIGKSSLLMMAGARLFPQKGKVFIEGLDSAAFLGVPNDPALEERRNKLVSFVYQNMEFETPESIGELFEVVKRNSGTFAGKPGLLDDMPVALELEKLLGKRMQELSKGDLQRAIIGLAMCYGARILIMDEPVFAMEERHKALCFSYLRSYCRATGTHLIYSAHDIHYCRDYADHMLLIRKDKSLLSGPAAEICTDKNLEESYGVPIETLYQREHLYREMLKNRAAKH